MARSINNILTKGLSGMVGKQLVFRTWNGKTFLSVAPKKPKKQSPLQKENRSKFKLATMFAKTMMKDPAKKAEYKDIAKKLKLPNAYTAAITEYMRKPEIKVLDTTTYTGKADEEVKIRVRKKSFEVQEVEVIVVDLNGEIIEEGKAIKAMGDWVYRTSAEAKGRDSVQIVAKVKDRTGNVIKQSFLKSFTLKV
jgi:hypothetical protein